MQRTLVEGADGWALHEPLRQHSAATRDLLHRIEAIGLAMRPAAFSDDDLVHIDFHHRNVIRSPGGDVRAIIDWEGARAGDRIFDLVTLAFGLALADCEPGVEQRVWSTIAGADPETIGPYVAHMALRHLDWAIRHHPDDVPRWIETSSRHLQRVARRTPSPPATRRAVRK